MVRDDPLGACGDALWSSVRWHAERQRSHAGPLAARTCDGRPVCINVKAQGSDVSHCSSHFVTRHRRQYHPRAQDDKRPGSAVPRGARRATRQVASRDAHGAGFLASDSRPSKCTARSTHFALAVGRIPSVRLRAARLVGPELEDPSQSMTRGRSIAHTNVHWQARGDAKIWSRTLRRRGARCLGEGRLNPWRTACVQRRDGGTGREIATQQHAR